MFQLLFRSVDALATAVEGAVVGAEPPADEGLAAELDAAAAGLGRRGARRLAGRAAAPARPIGRAPAARRGRRVRPVQVALRRDAVMRGARAALVLRRAEALGAVSARAAARRLSSTARTSTAASPSGWPRAASDEEILAALRAAGEVESVRFEDDQAEAAVRRARAGRSGWISAGSTR